MPAQNVFFWQDRLAFWWMNNWNNFKHSKYLAKMDFKIPMCTAKIIQRKKKTCSQLQLRSLWKDWWCQTKHEEGGHLLTPLWGLSCPVELIFWSTQFKQKPSQECTISIAIKIHKHMGTQNVEKHSLYQKASKSITHTNFSLDMVYSAYIVYSLHQGDYKLLKTENICMSLIFSIFS